MKIQLVALCSAVILTQTAFALDANVRDYGAVGNGVADDTAAIAAASHDVAKHGGTLTIPTGTYMLNPNRGVLEIGTNMIVTGSGVLKVIPGSGNFSYIIGPVPNYRVIRNVTIQGIGVDENVYNNPSLVAHAAGQMQNILVGYKLDNLTLDGVNFVLSGVYAVLTDDYLTMRNSSITFEKRPENPWFDNSSIYQPTQHSTCSITNNSWQGSDGANTAIEVHYTDNCDISYNSFDGYVTAALPMDCYSITLTHNNITRAQYAVSLWSQSMMQNVFVGYNNISLNNRDRQSNAASGVALYWCSYCTPVGDFQNITIQDNLITFQPEVRTNLAASSYWGIGVMPAGNVNGVLVTGNTIVNAPVRSIKVGNPFLSNRISNVKVQYNSILSPGNNTDLWWYEAAIALEGNLSNVSVVGNVIDNQASSFTGHYALWSNPAGTYAGVTTNGNKIDSVYQNSLDDSISQQ